MSRVGKSAFVSSSQSAERLDVLDGLRGLAIALVVWYHAWLVSGQGITGLNFVAEAGFLGVDLFFFISGFCIYFPYARAQREGRAGPTVQRFFTRRAVKILPSYLLALAVFAIVYHARFASPAEAAVQIASHLAFVHTLSPLTFGAISGPLWTIGVEVQFYLLFPLICPLFRKSPIVAYGALVGFAETYRVVVGQAGLGSTFLYINQLPAYLDVFGSGMFAAYILTTVGRPATATSRRLYTLGSLAAFALALAGLAEVAAISRNTDINAAYDWVNALRIAIGPLCIALALSTSFAVRRWRAILTTRAFIFLSMISYNLYLWNLEIAVWYRQAGFSASATFVLGIATALCLATAITYAIERPILEANLAGLWATLRARLGAPLPGVRDGASDGRTAAWAPISLRSGALPQRDSGR
jgi:peptidoglycan/LPS O-acetylase OafA/YrhL